MIETNVGLEPELQVQGFVKCTYDTLVDTLGAPSELSEKKAVWNIEGQPIKIIGKTLGTDDFYVYDITDWGIFGVGENNDSVTMVKSILDSKLGSLSKYVTRYDILRYF